MESAQAVEKGSLLAQDPGRQQIRLGVTGANGGWSFTAQAEGGEPFPIKRCWSAIHTREGDVWKICMLTWNITPAPAQTK